MKALVHWAVIGIALCFGARSYAVDSVDEEVQKKLSLSWTVVALIVVSRYLPRQHGRWVNVGAAATSAATIIGGYHDVPDYYFVAAVELLTLSYIAYTALKWPANDASAATTGVGFSTDSRSAYATYATYAGTF